jgi:hypothetical protein
MVQDVCKGWMGQVGGILGVGACQMACVSVHTFDRPRPVDVAGVWTVCASV